MLHTGVSLARRATESLELRIFDVREDGLGKQRTDALRRNGEWEKTAAGFRSICPSQSDDPSYQGVPDGNSEISVPSVLKKTCEGGISRRLRHAEIIFGTQSRREFGVLHLRCGGEGW